MFGYVVNNLFMPNDIKDSIKYFERKGTVGVYSYISYSAVQLLKEVYRFLIIMILHSV